MNNVPDPLLAGKELPTFKFALEKSEGKVIGNSSGKEATVVQLPISKGIAGVSMRLEPGAMRELHWHATAAEWAFVIEGRVRTTVIDPQGRAETNDFEPGDIWYFPRGHGHMLQCLGDKPCHFILIFDNGYFSEFGTFSITDWIGHTPKALLAKNFGLPESAFDGFPKDEVYFATRADRRPRSRRAAAGAGSAAADAQVSAAAQEPPRRSTRADASGGSTPTSFPISKTITGVILELEPGGLRELHWHPTADEWQYVIEGKISVTMFGSHGRYRTETLDKGDVGYIPQGYGHRSKTSGEKPCRVLIGFNTGHLRDDRPVAMDRRQSADVLATNFSKPAVAVREVPARTRLHLSDRKRTLRG